MTETLQQQVSSSTTSVQQYTIQTGDTLAKIAKVYYGSEAGWSKVHKANLGAIGGNPHELQVGLVLEIPA